VRELSVWEYRHIIYEVARVSGAATAQASGTIKTPSFLAAARRLLICRRTGRLGPMSAYVHLRAASEEELLLRVTPTFCSADETLRAEVVPLDMYAFDPAGLEAYSDAVM
jgi:hypothetical protein